MVEPFRFRSLGGLIACVKITECGKGDFVHVVVHGFLVVEQQGFDKVIVGRHISFEPALDHVLEHQAYFFVGQFESIFFPACVGVEGVRLHFQISAGKQQAPDRVFIVIKLVEDDLLVYFGTECAALQQILHNDLDIFAAFPDQLSHQTVAAGVGPVGSKFLLIKKIDN